MSVICLGIGPPSQGPLCPCVRVRVGYGDGATTWVRLWVMGYSFMTYLLELAFRFQTFGHVDDRLGTFFSGLAEVACAIKYGLISSTYFALVKVHLIPLRLK